jgi:Uma2 family endonuclease
MAIATLPYREEIEYPESDGKPVAESELHMLQLLTLLFVLRTYFANQQDVYVGANMMMYYVEGDPKQSVAPDVFVVMGVPKHVRRTFKVWQEGKAPDVVIELSSRGTKYEDTGTKRGLYEALGVQEYFIFDPQREYLNPPLRGYFLRGEGYHVEIGERLKSDVLGLELRVEQEELRLYDSQTGLLLPTPQETTNLLGEAEERLEKTEERLQKSTAQLQDEISARKEAELQAERLRAELDELRRKRG